MIILDYDCILLVLGMITEGMIMKFNSSIHNTLILMAIVEAGDSPFPRQKTCLANFLCY